MKDQQPQDSTGNNLPAAVEWERELDRAQVRTADVLHEFKDSITWELDGRHFTADISSPKARAKFKEMRKGYRTKAVEIQHKKSGAMSTVAMVDPHGGRRIVNEKLAEMEARNKGFREAGAMSRVGVRRYRLDASKFCPDCDLRWSWCRCSEGDSNGDA